MEVIRYLTVPSNLLVVLLVLGFLLLCLRWVRLGRAAVGLSLAGFLVFGFTSANELLFAPLDTRFPAQDPAALPPPHGLIVLGGNIDEATARTKGTVIELHDGAETVITAAILARRFPEARIILSGHGTGFLPPPIREIDGMKRILLEFGVAEARIEVDDAAESTVERIENTLALVGDARDRDWWLITPAVRMPRTVGVYRAAGFAPVPYPVDFRWIPPFHPLYFYEFETGLRLTDIAVHEWLGLILYRLQGRTDTLFPGPE